MKWGGQIQRVATQLPSVKRIAAEKTLQPTNETSKFGGNRDVARRRPGLILFGIACEGQFFFAISAWHPSQFKRCAQRTNIKYPRTFVAQHLECVLSMRCGFCVIDKIDFPPILVPIPKQIKPNSSELSFRVPVSYSKGPLALL